MISANLSARIRETNHPSGERLNTVVITMATAQILSKGLNSTVPGESRLSKAGVGCRTNFALWVLRQCPVPYWHIDAIPKRQPCMDQLNQLIHQILDSQRRLETLILNLDCQEQGRLSIVFVKFANHWLVIATCQVTSMSLTLSNKGELLDCR